MGKKESRAFDLTGEQVMAQLTPEEIKGFNLSLPQMTPTAKRFVYLLAQERIQKAALLAACKDAKETLEGLKSVLFVDAQGAANNRIKQLQSAIKAGEGV